MKCTFCGNDNNEASAYCSRCGKQLISGSTNKKGTGRKKTIIAIILGIILVILLCIVLEMLKKEDGEEKEDAKKKISRKESVSMEEENTSKNTLISEDAQKTEASTIIEQVDEFIDKEFADEGELKWKEAYLEYLKENGDADYGYSLDYIDEDNIPELVIETYIAADGNILCTYDGNKVVETYVGGGLQYRRQENLFITGGGNMGHYYDKIYKIEKGKPVVVSSGVFGILDSENILYNEIGEAIYQYRWNDKSVSEYDYKTYLEPFNYEEHAGIVCLSGDGYLYDIIEVLEHPLDITIIDPYINRNGYWGYINDYIVTFDGLMDDKIHFTVTYNDNLLGSVSATIIDSTTAEYQNDNSKLTIKFNVNYACLEIEGHIGNIDLTGSYIGNWG